jgi:hypothetical protein
MPFRTARPSTRRRLVGLLTAGLLALPLAAAAPLPATASSPVFLEDRFTGPDGLVTNVHAGASPSSRTAVHDGTWEQTSGSLYRRSNQGWTGKPDGVTPNAGSTNGTGSAVFRMRSHRSDIRNASVSFRLLNQGYTSTSRTPARNYDGLHVWLNYQSETELYYVSVNRRDGKVVVKRKTPGGTSNGGTYHVIGAETVSPSPIGTWQSWRVTTQTQPDGSVVIEAYRNGTKVLSRRDTGLRLSNGTWSPPLTKGGRIGFRGDNLQARFDDVVVAPLQAGASLPKHALTRFSVASATVYGQRHEVRATAWAGGQRAAGVPVTLQFKRSGSTTWSYAGTATTDSAGRVVFRPLATASGHWRTRLDARPGVSSAYASPAKVDVRVYGFIKTSATSVSKGSAVTLSGAVKPAVGGKKVSVQRYLDGRWSTIATVGTRTGGLYSVRVPVSRTATYRAVVTGWSGLASGTTGTLTVSVR